MGSRAHAHGYMLIPKVSPIHWASALPLIFYFRFAAQRLPLPLIVYCRLAADLQRLTPPSPKPERTRISVSLCQHECGLFGKEPKTCLQFGKDWQSDSNVNW